MYYGDFMLFDEAGKLEKGERVYLGDLKGKNERLAPRHTV